MIPPEPGPDPPTPVETYSMTANITFAAGTVSGLHGVLSLAYMMSSDGTEWTTVDSEEFTGGGSNSTAQVVLEGIPQGAARARLTIAGAVGTTTAVMKHTGDSWTTEYTFGSGNDGWDSDTDTDIFVKLTGS